MPSWRDLDAYKKDYLSGADLITIRDGREVFLSPTVTIERFEIKTVKQAPSMGGDKTKILLHFVGKDKYLILTRPHCQFFADLFKTDEVTEWRKGIKIKLTPQKKKKGKEWIYPITVSLPAAAPPQANTTPPAENAPPKATETPQTAAPPAVSTAPAQTDDEFLTAEEVAAMETTDESDEFDFDDDDTEHV